MIQETFAEMARRHRDSDMLVAGNFKMVDGKACSIGCFCYDYGLMTSDFDGLSKLTGYPEAAHRLQEAIFEGLPKAERADWHVAFADKAASVTDWRTCIDKTVLTSLRIAEPHDTSENKVVTAVIALYERRLNGDNPNAADWAAAWAATYAADAADAAWAAADAAGAAARAAAVDTADAADAEWAAADAAGDATYAAWAAASAAGDAADAAWAAASAAGDAGDAADAAWVKIRDAFLNA